MQRTTILKAGLVKVDIDKKNRGQIDEIISRHLKDGDLDILVAPEYSFYYDDGPQSKQDYKNEVHELARKTAGKKTLLLPGTFVWYDEKDELHSTLPVIHDGRLLLEYDKKLDGGDEEYIAQKFGKKYVKGTGPGSFGWNGLKAGVEICVEHATGTLHREREGKNDLDIQFIVSAGETFREANVTVRDYGYVLYCDGHFIDDVQMRQKMSTGGTKHVRPLNKVADNGGLLVYELNLDESFATK